MIFKIIALVLMAAFYACYFIKMLGQKRHGGIVKGKRN